MSALAACAAEAQAALGQLYARLRAAGCAAPAGAGSQLIRPVLSLAGAGALGGERTDAFWAAVAAVQLAHEASLLHDDVIDEAKVRRSEPTLVASRGVAVALVEGDHLLTTAYRLAAATGSLRFASAFAHAVERTVAGEKLQGRTAGSPLDETTYRTVVGMKSGELLGCALAAAPLVADAACADEWYVLGRRIGTLYQMLDDLLDYCPASETGKPALADFRQRRWTWPLTTMPGVTFEDDPAATARRFAAIDVSGASPLRRCLDTFHAEASAVRAQLAAHMAGDTMIGALVDSWTERAAAAVAATEAELARERVRSELVERLEGVADADACFRANSRSFSFAARAFPAGFRARVAELYTFCRFTDDLADTGSDADAAHRLALLDEWERVAAESYRGVETGVKLSDAVMSSAAAAGVPFEYVRELIEGMRMDVRGTTYASLESLRLYSYRVAGVVGQWMTRLCGVHDERVLEHAAQLGHAMQLTNILRDVGEDLRAGRVYLPEAELRAAGVSREQLEAAAAGASLPDGYVDLLEHLMGVADRDYGTALQATAALPAYFRRAVVIAAFVYRGINDAIRANGYDNLRRRARTTGLAKVRLAVRALSAGAIVAGMPPTPELHLRPVKPVRGRVAALVLLLAAASIAGASRAPFPVQAQVAPARSDARPPAAHVAELEAAAAARPDDAAVALDLVRALFFSAVDDEAHVRRGRDRVAALQAATPAGDAGLHALLTAYGGAFRMLEAKHGTWPPSRLRAVRAGLGLLDQAVQLAPNDLEIRYLRLVNTHYLPGLFGRRDSAREDMRALAGLLPHARNAVPPALYAVIADFVRANGG